MSIAVLDRWRHKIPFWWWLTYDALVGVTIVYGISPSDPAFWLGFFVLTIAVVIDFCEFLVKRPSSTTRPEAAPESATEGATENVGFAPSPLPSAGLPSVAESLSGPVPYTAGGRQ